MRNNKILAIFDFDLTIVKVSSPSAFFNYLSSKSGYFRFNLWYKFIKFISRVSNIKNYKMKLIIFGLMGYKYDKIKSIGESFSKNLFLHYNNKNIVRQLLFHIDKGHTLAIASASIDLIVEEYSKIFGIELICTSKISKLNNTITGFCEEGICSKYKKIFCLSKKLNFKNYDMHNSYCYSDSLEDDLPILKLVGKSFLVDKKGSIKKINT